MVIRIFYVYLFCLLWVSCSTSSSEEETHSSAATPQQQQVEQLEKTVLDIHDEVMPLMGELVSLKDMLSERNQILQSSDASEAQDQVILNEMIISNLDEAHEGMMNWMRSFRKVDPAQDAALSMDYLEQQRLEINEVKEMVFDAIAAANQALENSNSQMANP